MLLTRRLRLTSQWLAAKNNHDRKDPKRVFSRLSRIPAGEAEGLVYIASDLGRWEWAFLEARDALQLHDVAVSAIVPCYWFSAKGTTTYHRKFKRAESMVTEKFESLSVGQVIEMRFTLSKHIPPNTDGNGRFSRAPDESEFDAMLSHIGEALGMSEWGHARAYGRFVIQDPAYQNKKEQPVVEPVRPPLEPNYEDLSEFTD